MTTLHRAASSGSAHDARLRDNRVSASNDFASRPCGIRAGDGRHPGDACRTVSYGIHCPVKWQADQRCDAHVADNCRASAHYSRTIRRGTHAAKAESNPRIFGMQTILGRGGDEFADEFVHVQIAEPHRNANDFALRESC